MYKLIIVDDEKIIRTGLIHVINWQEIGFEIVEVFSDGQEVIEYLDYMIPDVILTDIKMNNVSGLDVARYVFEHKIPSKVVLISGYQEFELALQGLKYGAEDYLLKPIDVSRIEETFAKLKKQLDVTREEREKEKKERDRMNGVIPLLEESFFTDLVLGGVLDNEEYIRSRIHLIYPDLDVNNSSCFLTDIVIQDYENFMGNIWEYSYDQLETNIRNFLKIYKNSCFFHIVYKSGNLMEIAAIHNKGILTQEECDHSVHGLIKELEESFRFHLEYKICRRYDSLFEIGSIKEDAGTMNRDRIEDGRHIKEQKKLLLSNISVGNIVTAQKLFHHILEELDKGTAGERNNGVIALLSNMNELIKEVNGKLSNSLQSYFNYSLLSSMGDKEEIMIYCDRIFDRIKMADEKKEYYDTDSLINKAKQYLQDNLYRDISQEEIANYLFICPSYLSRLFKKQTGESFTQYVTRMKMDKAIELLKNPQYKTYQVGEELGYKTPRYFSRLFRTYTGMNPSDYRGKVLHLGGKFDEN